MTKRHRTSIDFNALQITIDHLGQSLPESVRPSFVKSCVAKLQKKFGPSYMEIERELSLSEAAVLIDQQIRRTRKNIDSYCSPRKVNEAASQRKRQK